MNINLKPVDASLNARRVVNGHATYNRNDGPLSAVIFFHIYYRVHGA